MNGIDRFLNKITMYKLVLAGLSLLAFVAIILGYARVIPYWGTSLIISLAVILFVCEFSNRLFGRIFKADRNVESAHITGFILFFLLQPLITGEGIALLIGASLLAMLSKYVFAINKRHIFNPVAITAVILGLLGSGAVIWWVGSPVLNILTLIIGLLIVRKLRRFPMLFAFLIASIGLSIFVYVLPNKISAAEYIKQIFLMWPLIFFATIMFTEPATTPPTKRKQIIYGIIVGLLFSAPLHVGTLYMTAELALVVGNIYSFSVSEKRRLKLRFKTKNQLSANVYDLFFEPSHNIQFKAGQYLEWTLPHEKPDARGNRRFFTIASSPTENQMHLGVRIDSAKSSTFKKALISMNVGDTMSVTNLSGTFTLPEDKNQKLVFIAGGIGATPYRSMAKFLADTNDRRDIVFFYQAGSEADLAYKHFFEGIKEKIGMRIEYVVPGNAGGRITDDMIKNLVPDFKDRKFYLSGPDAMVKNYEKMLGTIGVASNSIMTDYFPGY